jgi:hypothetical protein
MSTRGYKQKGPCTKKYATCPTGTKCRVKTGKCVKYEPRGDYDFSFKNKEFWVTPGTDWMEKIDPRIKKLKKSKMPKKVIADVVYKRKTPKVTLRAKRPLPPIPKKATIISPDVLDELINRFNHLSLVSNDNLTKKVAYSSPEEFSSTVLDVVNSPPSLFPSGRDLKGMLVSNVRRTSPSISPEEITKVFDSDPLKRGILSRRQQQAFSSSENLSEVETDIFIIQPSEQKVPKATVQNVEASLASLLFSAQEKMQKIVKGQQSNFKFEEDAWESEE